ncbi:MAG: TonB-dependent receptor [Pseudomonadota bacterium]
MLKLKRHNARSVRMLVLLGGVLAVQTSLAQNALEEIVVTATKRTESLQTIPLSISAISGEELQARGMTEFFDYAVTIPNLSFGAATDGVLSGRSISLRGIQGSNTTGFYIDDTPITETIDPRILEVERIEVLRGPQGTLYGGRSLGGTIRQITRQPQFDVSESRLRTGLSSTDESSDLNFVVSGSTNVPLSSSAAAIFSILYEENAGAFDRAVGTIPDHLGAPATLDGSPRSVRRDVDDRTTLAAQASFLIETTSGWSIAPRLMYQKTELDGFPLADIDPDNFTQNRDFDTPEGGEDEWYLATLNLKKDFSAGSFVSATSYFDRQTFEFEGSGSFINFLQALPGEFGGFGLFDVIPVTPVASPIFQTLNFESLTQEFRFASDLSGPMNFVVGGFYQDTDDDEAFQPRNIASGLEDNFRLLQTTLGIPGPIEDIWPFGDLVFTSNRPSSVEELGVFGEVTYDFNDRLTGTFGARWFDTQVEFSERQAGLAAGVPLANDASLDTIAATTGGQTDSGFIFKAALEYELGDSTYLYGSVAEGFRIGGANGLIPDSLGCPQNLIDLGLEGVDTSQFESDDLVSTEIGLKMEPTTWSRLNVSLFHIDFEDIQQPVQLTCGFQFVGNFGAARSQGVEIEYTARPTDRLGLSLNFGYTDAEFTETTFGGALNSDGDALQFVPEITASAAFDYLVPNAWGAFDLIVNGDFSYVDDSISRVNSIERPRDSYEFANLRFRLANDRYGFTFFIRNLTNDIANLADNRSLAAETPGRPRFVVSRPRTVGLEFNVDF